MRKIVGLVLAIGLAQTALAQDVIKTMAGEDMLVKIKEVTNTEVVYQPYSDSTAADQRIAMDQVQMIKLEKGTARPELFKNLDKSQYAVASGNADQNRFQGKTDARRLYKGRGAMWGTFAATAVFPPAGLVTGAIVAATPPNINNLAFDPALMNDPDYRNAFKKQAHNKKAGKAAAGFGLGIGAYVVFYTVAAVIILLTWG